MPAKLKKLQTYTQPVNLLLISADSAFVALANLRYINVLNNNINFAPFNRSRMVNALLCQSSSDATHIPTQTYERTSWKHNDRMGGSDDGRQTHKYRKLIWRERKMMSEQAIIPAAMALSRHSWVVCTSSLALSDMAPTNIVSLRSPWKPRWYVVTSTAPQMTSRTMQLSAVHVRTPLPSVLWHCVVWRHQEEHPACKNWVMRCWCGYVSGARCRLFAYGPADATAISKPHHLLPHWNPDWFYLSGTSLPRLYWKRGR